MSHIDDGALHAYLDGALESFPTAEADRIRDHLESCDACSRRLEEEQALRAEASNILAGAAAPVDDMPPFEELRARAVARERPRPQGAGRLTRLAWAASLVIGLGSGWMLRGMSAPPFAAPSQVESLDELFVDEAAPVRSELEAPPESAAADREGVTVLGATDAAKLVETSESDQRFARTGAEEPTAAAPVASAGQTTAVAVARDQVEENEALSREEVVAGDTSGSGLRSRIDAVPMVRTDSAGQRVGAEVRPAPAADLDDRVQRRALAEEREARQVGVSELMAEQDPATPGLEQQLGRTAGEEKEEGSLVVPGLEVVSVAWLEGRELNGAVRVLQLLESGDTLELVHLPGGTDPSVLSPPTDDRTELVVPRGAGWLVARAMASREVLEAVLARMAGA